MFKYITFAALFTIATAASSFIAQPVVAKVGAVVHTVPSATSHQSIIQVHNNAHIVTPVVKAVTPVVETYSAPVVPVVKTVAPVVPVVHAAPVVPVVKTYFAPVIHHVPVVKSVVSHVVHAAPIVKSVFSAPVAHLVHH
ncbi:PREDICTED: uncharacterized protein LOC108977190 [Bactrocera latifrons]|uniref:uncharacterized protein LOC108977190 n=1 Tax=Bactrocera latifrons TaxID=174628 RepID=UPI0008DD65D4|nr:PREDICTED: uncharacterized protein LOC108977190 [Bactrocera latifrons]